jgi:hypothetical protein
LVAHALLWKAIRKGGFYVNSSSAVVGVLPSADNGPPLGDEPAVEALVAL